MHTTIFLNSDIDLTAITLAEYLELMFLDAEAWMRAGPDRWTGILTEDLAHWHGYGITTAVELGEYLDAQVDEWTTEADIDYFESEDVWKTDEEIEADAVAEYVDTYSAPTMADLWPGVAA